MNSFCDAGPHRRERGELKIPWALDLKGRVVPAADAQRGSEYRCPNPACSATLIVRAGPKRTRHFSHRVEATCNVETALHWAAKYRLAGVVVDWVQGGLAPSILRKCPKCGKERGQRLPATVRGATVEVPHGDIRPDVTLVDGAGTAIAAVEVYVTHQVGGQKAQRFPCAWIEVEAEAILKDPYTWVPRQHGNLREFACDHVPPYREPAPGQYVVILVGEDQEWTERYRALGHASQITRLYLRKYYAGRPVKVIIDSAEGRHIGAWNGSAWSRSPALDGTGVDLSP